ncbi:GAF domain-containing protein [Spirillospora sp. CA-294931]|uniref:GAF domain-containing protein n=1 Tax=Spirillospora sp. CA-294931 TaxID=3240042 RepID=UPI003D8B7165
MGNDSTTRALARGHEAAHSGHEAGPVIRPLIAESWRRSREAGADPGVRSAPLVYDADVVADVRAAHPLDPHLPMLRDLLRNVADEAEYLMVITDAEGHALWSDGPPRVRRQADGIGLLEGFCWSEGAVGTNGIGTALAEGRPEFVYAAEHLAPVLHGWSCAGAPITDPDTGSVIACVDVSATVDALHPATVALVAAAARLAEAHLDLEMRRRDERLRERYLRRQGAPGVLVTSTGRVVGGDPGMWNGRRLPVPVPGQRLTLPDGRAAVAEPIGEAFLLRPSGDGGGSAPAGRPLLSLSMLGSDQPRALLDGAPVPLSLRHAEILALLATHPGGLSGDRLSWHLYGEDGSPGTVRAEIHRLRGQLGGVVRAKPYRLDCQIDADFLTVARLLDDGDVAAAARLCRGELLPRSDAPGIRAERDELAVRMRRQVLDRGGIDSLWAFAQTEPGRVDLEVLQRLDAVLPRTDPRRAAVALRGDRLLDPE